MTNIDRIFFAIIAIICGGLIYALISANTRRADEIKLLRARITKLESESITHQRELAAKIPALEQIGVVRDGVLTIQLRSIP